MEQKNEILKNRANIVSTQEPICNQCDEPLIFALQDRNHQFSIGVSTILQCLKFAEQQHAIPPLPEEWWEDINTRYNLS